jgi:hypothetical protein
MARRGDLASGLDNNKYSRAIYCSDISLAGHLSLSLVSHASLLPFLFTPSCFLFSKIMCGTEIKVPALTTRFNVLSNLHLYITFVILDANSIHPEKIHLQISIALHDARRRLCAVQNSHMPDQCLLSFLIKLPTSAAKDTAIISPNGVRGAPRPSRMLCARWP